MVKRLIRRVVYRALFHFCAPLKQTAWYRNQFVDRTRTLYPDREWHLSHDERNFDLAVLGSSSGKWGFDFSGFQIKAFNWAQQPQYLQNDLRVLKNYHSFLRKGAKVIVNVSPLSGLYVPDNLEETIRYLHVIDSTLLNQKFLPQARRFVSYPALNSNFAFKQAIKEWIKKVVRCRVNLAVKRFDREDAEHNAMEEAELRRDADKWMSCWRKEFDIEDFEWPLSPENGENRSRQVSLMQELVDFIRERGYEPVFVLVPVSRFLGKNFTEAFKRVHLVEFFRQIERSVPILDYLTAEEFSDPDLYFNSFFLNRRGRKLFTARILKDLGLLSDGDGQ